MELLNSPFGPTEPAWGPSCSLQRETHAVPRREAQGPVDGTPSSRAWSSDLSFTCCPGSTRLEISLLCESFREITNGGNRPRQLPHSVGYGQEEVGWQLGEEGSHNPGKCFPRTERQGKAECAVVSAQGPGPGSFGGRHLCLPCPSFAIWKMRIFPSLNECISIYFGRNFMKV